MSETNPFMAALVRSILDPRRSVSEWTEFAAERERERFKAILKSSGGRGGLVLRDLPTKDSSR